MKKTWLALLLILALLLTACGEKAPAWQEQYDLGIRYLSEGNYAEAIIAFTAAIQIDPKQETVYLALSEAYAASGNIEKAAETLRQAIAQLGETEELALALDYAERGVVHTERQENPDGSYSIYEFDANGRQIRTTYYNPDGSVSGVDEYEYDANGSTLRTACRQKYFQKRSRVKSSSLMSMKKKPRTKSASSSGWTYRLPSRIKPREPPIAQKSRGPLMKL